MSAVDTITQAALFVQDPAMPGALSRKMMQKIVNVEYSYPPNVVLSPEVKDLLSKIFVKDPVTRIKIPQMLQHPWYVHHCVVMLPAVTQCLNHLTPMRCTWNVIEFEQVWIYSERQALPSIYRISWGAQEKDLSNPVYPSQNWCDSRSSAWWLINMRISQDGQCWGINFKICRIWIHLKARNLCMSKNITGCEKWSLKVAAQSKDSIWQGKLAWCFCTIIFELANSRFEILHFHMITQFALTAANATGWQEPSCQLRQRVCSKARRRS